MSSTNYTYKTLETFEPIYYRQWASTVRDAFAERGWTKYLQPPVASESKDPESPSTSDTPEPFSAKAFLSQSIPLQHKAIIEGCHTAGDIWRAFEQRYGTHTREDELRLEQEVLETVKVASDTIDIHIQKFDNLMASLKAQQELSRQYDDPKVNRIFLYSLEKSQIPDEDWMGFITYLGKSGLNVTPDTLYSEARTYYRTHLAHKKPQTPASGSPDELVLTSTTFAPSFPPPVQSGQRGHGRGHGRGRGNDTTSSQRSRAPPNLPRDPNAWCTHCEIPGHSFDMCWKKTQKGQQSTGTRQQPAPLYECNSKPTLPKAPSRRLTKPALESYSGLQHSSIGWVYGSACTQHLTGNPLHFTTYDEFPTPIPAYGTAGDNVHYAYGQGSVILQDGKGNKYKILDVWWVPKSRYSIICKARTKLDGLCTKMDEDENICLFALDGSRFSITSTEVNQMTMFMSY